MPAPVRAMVRKSPRRLRSLRTYSDSSGLDVWLCRHSKVSRTRPIASAPTTRWSPQSVHHWARVRPKVRAAGPREPSSAPGTQVEGGTGVGVGAVHRGRRAAASGRHQGDQSEDQVEAQNRARGQGPTREQPQHRTADADHGVDPESPDAFPRSGETGGHHGERRRRHERAQTALQDPAQDHRGHGGGEGGRRRPRRRAGWPPRNPPKGLARSRPSGG